MAIINGTFLPDILLGTSEDDIINGFGGLDTISGGDGNDVIDGGEGDDILIGGNGDDILIGGLGSATLLSLYNGGEGNDVMIASTIGVAEDFDGGDGIDTVSFAARISGVTTYLSVLGIPLLDTVRNVENVIGSAFGDVITGDGGNNVLDGGAGDDLLDGGGGNDVLIGGLGADTMAGGFGNDTYYVDQSGDMVSEAVNAGNDRIVTSISYTLAAGNEVETLEAAAGGAAINLTGNEFGQTLIGNAGANRLEGAGGDDTYLVDSADDQVVEAGGQGNDAVYTTVSYQLGMGQSVELLASRDNSLTVAMNLFGNELNNVIFGNAGANFIDGGAGADVMTGFGGDDVYAVDNAGDVVIEGAGGGNDTIYSSFSYVLGFGSSVETLASRDNSLTVAMNLFGNELDNFIYGNNGANFLDGGTGADTMTGFGGDDIYAIDNVNDRVVEDPGGGNDAIYTTLSYVLATGHSIEVLASRDNSLTTAMNLTGNELANIVMGNNGANVLNGGGGADILLGFAGADTFAFTTAPAAGNADTIADFFTGTDKIALDDAVFQGIGSPGAFNASAFVAGAAAADGDDRLVYNAATGQLFYDADGNGGGAAVLVATLSGTVTLSASDFLVI